MDKQYLCPGKINTDKKMVWYSPVSKYPSYHTYCENCFKEYSNLMENIAFTVNKDKNNRCYWNKNFDDSSITVNDIKISVFNPENYYRYKKVKSKTFDTTLTIGIPQNHKYMVSIESCDDDVKLTVECIVHRDIKNSSLTLPEISHIIDKINYTDDLVFNDKSDYNLITFKVKKWIKSSDKDLHKYYVMKDNSTKFTINLVRNENEIQRMNREIEKSKSLNVKINKIVIVNDFV